MHTVLIGTLTYNRLDFTKKYIKALYASTNPMFDLIILDNNSTDGTQEFLLEQEKLHDNLEVILSPENVGVAAGMNKILEKRKPSQHFMKLDNDIVINTERKNWLSKMVGIVESGYKVKSKISKTSKEQIATIGGIGLRPHILHTEFSTKATVNDMVLEFPPEGALGCSTLYKNEAIDKIGKYCDDYEEYGYEDADYNVRLSMAGYITVFWSEIETLHIDPGEHDDYFDRKQFLAKKNNNLYFQNYNAYVEGKKGIKL